MVAFLVVVVLVAALAGIGYGVFAMLSTRDPGLVVVEPDGWASPLPRERTLTEPDIRAARFDYGLRGYRMDQVDAALRRISYDLGYKSEVIAVLEAEVAALREGRAEDAEQLRQARLASRGDAAVADRG